MYGDGGNARITPDSSGFPTRHARARQLYRIVVSEGEPDHLGLLKPPLVEPVGRHVKSESLRGLGDARLRGSRLLPARAGRARTLLPGLGFLRQFNLLDVGCRRRSGNGAKPT